MSKSDYIPRKDSLFYVWVTSFFKALAAIYERIKFPFDLLESLQITGEEFRILYEKAESEETRTKISIFAKNECRKKFEKEVRHAVKEYLTSNHLVTNADRISLGIPIYKSERTPSPVAEDAPELLVDGTKLGKVSIHFYAVGSIMKKGKPEGQHGAEFGWMISETRPKHRDELPHSAFDTNSPFTIQFDDEMRGKTLWFVARWENTRGQKGPWSEMRDTIIP
ncbi:MAG: hypothetical protein LBJ17_02075 [Dysgonamonadaceae bacterium]|jgi:hypothetical protein|nr:hypothetical protein [Dysgonamonadaceae bacterium]